MTIKNLRRIGLPREVAMNSIVITVAATLLIFAGEASAQWMKHPDNSVPRTADGNPNFSAPAPRLADGKPDLSGVWLPDNDPAGSRKNVENTIFPRYFVN